VSEETCSLTETEKETVVDKLTRIGCIEEHYKVQDCYYESRDWRKCKNEVEAFRNCLQTKKQQNENVSKNIQNTSKSN
jgi:cytochrome c oxidase assembly factor 4